MLIKIFRLFMIHQPGEDWLKGVSMATGVCASVWADVCCLCG